MLQLVLAMRGQGQIGWAATSMLPPAALGLAGASWRTANGKKLTTAWRSKQHCRYSVSQKQGFVWARLHHLEGRFSPCISSPQTHHTLAPIPTDPAFIRN